MALTADAPETAPPAEAPRRGPGAMALRAFADQCRAYLVGLPEMQKTAP